MASRRVKIPNTPVARRQRIAELLGAQKIRSQSQLETLLADDDLVVTQATLSRDLEDLGAVKVRDGGGGLHYAIPGEADRSAPTAVANVQAMLARRCEEVLVSAEVSANFVILRTPPGAAHFLAYVIDKADLDEVIGTIAGDDTVFLVTRDPDGGQMLADRLTRLAEGVDRSEK